MRGRVKTEEVLAVYGGAPVRRAPMPPQFIGANLVGEEELSLVTEVIRTRSLFRHYGPKHPHMVEDFEKEACAFFETRYALATATGSGSVYCALAALGIGPGDEVIIPTFGWHTDFNAVVLSGALPVFAEIDEGLNLNPESFEENITGRTRAVIVVHYQGGASKVDQIVAIARRHGVKVIEDVAQACGGTYNGRRLATFGDVACFSLQQNKVITAGDGGLLVTNDQEVFERAVRMHDLGMMRPVFETQLASPVKTEAFAGFQWRMNELTGAVALAQLRKLPAIVSASRKSFAFLREYIRSHFPGLKMREVEPKNDIGIALFLNLGCAERVQLFSDAYRAEGLTCGPTSNCAIMSTFPQVISRNMPHKDLAPFGKGFAGECFRYTREQYARSEKIAESMAGIAVLPVYTEQDMCDIARGAVKVLRHILAAR